MEIITIVGAGMMGSAMAIPAHDNCHAVRLVGTPLDRKIGTLLGCGTTIDQALVILDGVTLESIAVTKSVIGALDEQQKRGVFDMARVPLLAHIKELVTGIKTIDIPWEKF